MPVGPNSVSSTRRRRRVFYFADPPHPFSIEDAWLLTLYHGLGDVSAVHCPHVTWIVNTQSRLAFFDLFHPAKDSLPSTPLGNPRAVQLLRTHLNRRTPLVVLTGATGVGKRTTLRILCKQLGLNVNYQDNLSSLLQLLRASKKYATLGPQRKIILFDPIDPSLGTSTLPKLQLRRCPPLYIVLPPRSPLCHILQIKKFPLIRFRPLPSTLISTFTGSSHAANICGGDLRYALNCARLGSSAACKDTSRPPLRELAHMLREPSHLALSTDDPTLTALLQENYLAITTDIVEASACADLLSLSDLLSEASEPSLLRSWGLSTLLRRRGLPRLPRLTPPALVSLGTMATTSS